MRRCNDCPALATVNAYAGWWRRIDGRWVMQTRPLCGPCAREDARARAEAIAS